MSAPTHPSTGSEGARLASGRWEERAEVAAGVVAGLVVLSLGPAAVAVFLLVVLAMAVAPSALRWQAHRST